MARSLLIVLAFSASVASADSTPPGANKRSPEMAQTAAAPETLLKRIAYHLDHQKAREPRLVGFEEAKAIHGDGDRMWLDYEHATRDVPNPDYDRQVREAEEEDRRRGPRLRAVIPRTHHVIDPDGVVVHLLLERERVARMEQRVFPAYARVGEWLLEVHVEGGRKAPDPGLGAIQRAIDEEIERTAGGQKRP
jgi:hypothetical protein